MHFTKEGKHKRVLRKNLSVFLVANIIIAIVAVSYSLQIVDAQVSGPQALEVLEEAALKKDILLKLLFGSLSNANKPTKNNLPPPPIQEYVRAPGQQIDIPPSPDELADILKRFDKYGIKGVEGIKEAIFKDGKWVDAAGKDITSQLQRAGCLNKKGLLFTKCKGATLTGAKEGGAGGEFFEGIQNFVGNIFGYEAPEPGIAKGFTTGGGAIDAIVSSTAWGLSAYYGSKFILGIFSDNQAFIDAGSLALGWGVFAGRASFTAFESGLINPPFGLSAAQAGFAVGAIVTVAIFLLTYKEESTKTVTFQCFPWEPPIGGASCEKCNQDPLKPCSEYRCRSLGQACQLLNVGTEEERCTWVNPKDVNPPVIKALDAALLDGYRYTPNNAIQPPDAGVKVENTQSTTKCVKPFTPLRFGIVADEPAQCKIDYKRPGAGRENTTTSAYEAMQFYMGGSNAFRYNHTEILSLPGPSVLKEGNATSPILGGEGEYNLYVRCMDANGNQNIQSFVFSFCVDKGPDTTPPLIVTTSIFNNMPVQYNQTSVPLDVYVNEPSECKWSTTDTAFKDMENSMQCSDSVFEMNANLLYRCRTTLTGLKNAQDNTFYFRCKDQPGKNESERNENRESYQFTLKGTQPLDIISAKPNNTVIKDSTTVVAVPLEVETQHGFDKGKAICYYSTTGRSDDYVAFFSSDNYQHKQTLNLISGDYGYFIRCVDLGGNADTTRINFTVEVDTLPPIVVRAYHEENNLKIITSEDARCRYSRTDCNFVFEDGIQMTTLKEREHFTDWNLNTNYYIKCEDQYHNLPLPTQCSILVKPFSLVQETGGSG